MLVDKVVRGTGSIRIVVLDVGVFHSAPIWMSGSKPAAQGTIMEGEVVLMLLVKLRGGRLDTLD